MPLSKRNTILQRRYTTTAHQTGHQCMLVRHSSYEEERGKGAILKNKFFASFLISLKNQCSFLFFRSRKAVRLEKEKQISQGLYYIIHPFSTFRANYDFYVFILYIITVIHKPIEGAFYNRRFYNESPWMRYICSLFDLLSFIDIIINFFSGYVVYDKRVVELELKKIARHYALGPFFVCDLLSCVPKSVLYLFPFFTRFQVCFLTISICCMLKIVRISSIVDKSNKIITYKGYRLSTFISMLRATLITYIIIHFSACILYFIPRHVRNLVYKGSLPANYVFFFFKSSAYLLSIRLDMEQIEPKFPEEYVLAIIFYIVGKIVVAAVWISLVSIMEDSRSAAINYRAKMNQVEEYLKQKEIPLELRIKIDHFLKFKFKGALFKEKNVERLLSNRLRKETKLANYQQLLSNIPLLSMFSHEEFAKIQSHFDYEILSPNNTIFHSGDEALHFFFLLSGTVAVYTHSGKEMVHLSDGAYFGEIALIKNIRRQATVVTLEFCEVLKLDRKSFKKYMMNNQKVASQMNNWAQIRFQDIVQVEYKYRLKESKDALGTQDVAPK